MIEENRFKHTYVQISTGGERRKSSSLQNEIEKQLSNLYRRHDNQELDAAQLLHQLSLLISKKI